MNVIIYLSLMILELIVLLGVCIYGVGLLFSAFKGAPYVPTSKRQLDGILAHANLRKDANLVELGSGDGRLIRYAVKHFEVSGVGIEINPLLVWWSRYLSRRDGIADRVSFVRQNVFDYSLHKVDYLYIFLMPELIKALLPKFKRELKKGVVIISHGFKIPGFERHLFHVEPDKAFSTFYYKV
jgi:hypothetical protein